MEAWSDSMTVSFSKAFSHNSTDLEVEPVVGRREAGGTRRRWGRMAVGTLSAGSGPGRAARTSGRVSGG